MQHTQYTGEYTKSLNESGAKIALKIDVHKNKIIRQRKKCESQNCHKNVFFSNNNAETSMK